MAVFLGLAAALTYGTADFVGGLVSKRASVYAVVVISQLVGVVAVAGLLPFDSAATGVEAALGWGAAAGVGGGLGVMLLYRGLATGRMSVVAPITAVEAAIVPLVWGLGTGERPTTVALVGVAIALLAVVLITWTRDEPGDANSRAGVREAIGAGLGFGAFFVFLDYAPSDSGLWPLLGTKLSSITLVFLIALVSRATLRPPAGTIGAIILAGVLDLFANVFYLLATRRGLLALVAVLTSLYPAATVLLARLVLKEEVTARQGLGLFLALTGVALISAG